MNEKVFDLLGMMFLELYGEDVSYKLVDDFYGYLGYTLEAEPLLNKLDIHSTSDLMEVLDR